MKVDDDLETNLPSPSDCLVQVGDLALDVWVPGLGVDCPVPDRDSHVIQPSRGDSAKVGLCDPGAPVSF
jgi:hypothetical protein